MKRFGQKATIAQVARQGVRPVPNDARDEISANFYAMAMQTIQDYTTPGGQKLINARVQIDWDDKALYLDLIADLVEQPAFYAWYGGFSPSEFQRNVNQGIAVACQKWFNGEYTVLMVDTKSVTQVGKRA